MSDLHPLGAMGLTEICDGGIYHIFATLYSNLWYQNFVILKNWHIGVGLVLFWRFLNLM